MSAANHKGISIPIPKHGRTKSVSHKKLDYATKLKSLLDTYDSFLIISVNNVAGEIIDGLRKDFRQTARFLFGRNTLIRKIIRDYIAETGKLKLCNLLYAIRGNCGFVFTTKDQINTLRNEFSKRTKYTRLKIDQISPVDVFIPPGPTRLEPTQTSYLSVCNIGTRINRGMIHIDCEVHLVMKGEKVHYYKSCMMDRLGIKPVCHKIQVENVYSEGQWERQYFKYAVHSNTIQMEDIAHSLYGYCFPKHAPKLIGIPRDIENAYMEAIAFGLELKKYSWKSLDTIEKCLITIKCSQYDKYKRDSLLVYGYVRMIQKLLCNAIIPIELYGICFEYYYKEETPKPIVIEQQDIESESESMSSSPYVPNLGGMFDTSSDDMSD